eukprot:TRINITY_DN12991_c0_g4_i2.p1 TRINITY_DN12991_c0_g4~~TRINITY_DN12991_c0_g4_i2.p1  ORF type:complete len:546 (+),score=171.58 TRINITY_DN12991_c0_g4_i2:395-2032(+)
MIDKIDENSELMVVLAEQLGLLSGYIGPKEHLPILLKPLELIANSDESVVREKTVEALTKIAGKLDSTQHGNDFLPLVKKLAKGDTYMVKITSTGLFAPVYPHVSATEQEILRQFYITLCKDDTPMVRRAAAANFPKFALVIDHSLIKADFVSVIQSMMTDTQDSVKVAAVEAGSKLIVQLKNKEVSETLLASMKAAIADSKAWRLRFTLAEITPSILESLSSPSITEYVLPWIAALLIDTEAEVRSQSLLALPSLSKHCTPELLAVKILPSLNGSLLKDPSEHVRSSLGGVICEVGGTFPKRQAEEDKADPMETYVIPVCVGLSKDENMDVRLSLFQSIHHIIGSLTNKQIETHIIPLLMAVSSDKQWRVRNEVVKYLPELARKVDTEAFKDRLIELSTGFLTDPAYQIRKEATEALAKLAEIFGSKWLEEQVLTRVNEFKASQNYLLRVNMMLFISRLKMSLSAELINEKLLPVILSLKDDTVPSVRLNVAKCIEVLAQQLSDSNLRREAVPVLKKLLGDSDFDVRYYTEKAMQNERVRNFCF